MGKNTYKEVDMNAVKILASTLILSVLVACTGEVAVESDSDGIAESDNASAS